MLVSACTVRPVRVVVAPMRFTTTSWLVSGRPRQFIEMCANSRCSILFHFLAHLQHPVDVTGGRAGSGTVRRATRSATSTAESRAGPRATPVATTTPAPTPWGRGAGGRRAPRAGVGLSAAGGGVGGGVGRLASLAGPRASTRPGEYMSGRQARAAGRDRNVGDGRSAHLMGPPAGGATAESSPAGAAPLTTSPAPPWARRLPCRFAGLGHNRELLAAAYQHPPDRLPPCCDG